MEIYRGCGIPCGEMLKCARTSSFISTAPDRTAMSASRIARAYARTATFTEGITPRRAACEQMDRARSHRHCRALTRLRDISLKSSPAPRSTRIDGRLSGAIAHNVTARIHGRLPKCFVARGASATRTPRRSRYAHASLGLLAQLATRSLLSTRPIPAAGHLSRIPWEADLLGRAKVVLP